MRRFAFRRFLVRHARFGRTAEIRSACQEVLSDPQTFDDAYNGASEEFYASNGAIGDGHLLQAWIDWLSNGGLDKILEIITKILSVVHSSAPGEIHVIP